MIAIFHWKVKYGGRFYPAGIGFPINPADKEILVAAGAKIIMEESELLAQEGEQPSADSEAVKPKATRKPRR